MENIQFSLEKDINEIFLQKLRKAGFKIPNKLNISGFECYANMMFRLVEPRPRTIHLPQKIKIPAEHLRGINLILKKFKMGANVNSHQSRHIKNINFLDAFLQDFGFHHFHLGEKYQSTGKDRDLIVRTGYEIIAKVDVNDVYIIGVYKHSKKENCHLWAKTELLEICYENWPHLLDAYVVRGVLGNDKEISEEDRIKLRGAYINVPIKLKNGVLLFSPGGGFTGNGISINMRREINKLMNKLYVFKKQIFESSIEIPGNSFFKVISFDMEHLCLVEDKQRTVILIKEGKNTSHVIKFNFGHGIIKYMPPLHANLNKTTETILSLYTISSPHFLSPFPSIINTENKYIDKNQIP